MSESDSDGLEEFLPDDFNMYPASCFDSVPTRPGIYILIQIISKDAKSHPYQYIGHGGDLKERLKQHLCEDSGTFTGEKKAVVLNPGKLTEVGLFEVPADLEWPSSVEKPTKMSGDDDKKYLKRCGKVMAEALEELAKNHSIYSPVLNDRGRVTKKAKALLGDEEFKSKLEKILEGELTRISLPSARALYEENKALKARLELLERETEKE